MLPIQRRQAILVGYYPHEVTTRRTIIAHSGASYVLGDSSKLGTVAVHRVCPVSGVTARGPGHHGQRPGRRRRGTRALRLPAAVCPFDPPLRVVRGGVLLRGTGRLDRARRARRRGAEDLPGLRLRVDLRLRAGDQRAADLLDGAGPAATTGTRCSAASSRWCCAPTPPRCSPRPRSCPRCCTRVPCCCTYSAGTEPSAARSASMRYRS